MFRFLACALISGVCIRAISADVASPGMDDAPVLSAIIETLCEESSAHLDGYRVLSNESVSVGHDAGKIGLNEEATASLNERNKVRHPLPALALCAQIVEAKRQDIAAAFRHHDLSDDERMSAFYKRFPGATDFLELSLPGYSTDGTSALVVVGGAYGDFYWVLHKVDRVWIVEKSIYRSIS